MNGFRPGPTQTLGSLQFCQIIPHDHVEASKNRVADQRMTDGNFIQMREVGKDLEVCEIQIVAGVDPHTQSMSLLGRGGIQGKLPDTGLTVRGKGSRKGLCIKLDAIRPDPGRPCHRLERRTTHSHAHAHATPISSAKRSTE